MVSKERKKKERKSGVSGWEWENGREKRVRLKKRMKKKIKGRVCKMREKNKFSDLKD